MKCTRHGDDEPVRPSAAALRELLAMADHCGRNLLLAQAAGGNNSVKSADSDVLWVKASGTPMSAMSAEQGFIGLRLSESRSLVQDKRLRAMRRREAQDASVQRLQELRCFGSPQRPSLEAGFHAYLPQRAILHTHSVYLNAYTCMQGGREAAGEELPAHVWIPYVAPGFELAVAVADESQKYGPETMLLLENHGFVAAAETAQQTIEQTETFVAAAQRYFGIIPANWLIEEEPSTGLLKWMDEMMRTLAVRFPTAGYMVGAGRFAAFRKAATEDGLLQQYGALVPDDVVYASSVWLAKSDPASFSRNLPDDVPDTFAVVVPGEGLLLAGRNEARLRALEEMLFAQVLVRWLISRRGKPRALPTQEIEYLASMESEIYRRSLTAAKAAAGGAH